MATVSVRLLGQARSRQPCSTLAGLEPTVRLIDHIDTSFAPDDTIVAMPGAQRLERIADFHGTVS
jgi:hypothetical protein